MTPLETILAGSTAAALVANFIFLVLGQRQSRKTRELALQARESADRMWHNTMVAPPPRRAKAGKCKCGGKLRAYVNSGVKTCVNCGQSVLPAEA